MLEINIIRLAVREILFNDYVYILLSQRRYSLVYNRNIITYHGLGKSTISKIIALYVYHRLDCCTDVFKSLGIAGNSKLGAVFFHSSFETAKNDFKNYINTVFEVSPYFRKPYHRPPIRFIPSGPTSGSHIIGVSIIYGCLSELGFFRPRDGVERASELVTRFDSRFSSKRFVFGALVADSSAKDQSNEAVTKFESLVPPEELYRAKFSQWEMRPDNYNLDGKTFRFYIGDNIQGPRVVEDSEDIIKSGLDEDRIINVPLSAKYKFLADPIRNLRDLAGISYSGDEKFFNGNISHLVNCSSLKNYAPEEIIVDFFAKEDTIYSHVENMIYRIPRGTSLFVHYDIGLKKDKTGIALCYYDGEKEVSPGYTLPKFKVPLAFVVSRKKGQATSLDHLYQFLKDLVKNGYIVEFSADSFASQGILQSCERDGIPFRSLSVDKTMEAYNLFKNVVNTERLEIPYNNILLRECSELLVTYNGVNGEHCKVDHPAVSSCTEFDYADKTGKQEGTKDCADGVVGALFNCYSHYAQYQELGMNGGVNKTLQSFKTQTTSAREETQKLFQGMLNNIF